MTAHALKGDQERCLAAGMDAYVSKPIRTTELFETIERTLELADNLSRLRTSKTRLLGRAAEGAGRPSGSELPLEV
jgi:two-component system, sensor histidine kinase and response regulator